MQEEIIGTLIIGMYKPILEEEIRLLLTMCNLVAGVIYRANLMDQINKTYRATIQGWASALEIREQEKKGHSQNVVNLTEALARRVGYSESEVEEIINGAYLHDIGKMGIPDDILFKPGKFTNEDWKIMRQHPVFAKQLLDNIPHLGKAIHVPYYHHEHWDGSGYPEGLAGYDIPLNARIFSIIDVWDALLTARIYRPAWEPKQVMQYIYSQSGRLFDPALVEEFAAMAEEMGLIA
jgi:response regulator RpfG family c-di-GMP phosphodiesterase